MRKLSKNKKFIIVLILAVLISVTSSYVLAQTLINSKDVVYEDNSNLMADNVQEAIDGTCSKIDTRLSDIEDKLYTVKKINGITNEIQTTTSYSYTGLSVTFPAKSYCYVAITNAWAASSAQGIILSASKDNVSHRLATSNISEDNIIYGSYSGYVDTETTYYVWLKYAKAGEKDIIYYNGWCATKYK